MSCPVDERDIIKQDAFFFSNKKLKIAVSILKLVPPTRIELVMTGYQPIVIPFNYRGIIWWIVKESNLTAATLHINGNGFTVRRREYDPNFTHTLLRMCRIK